MKELSLLIKPASGRCNLRCAYCFYEDEKLHRQMPDYGIMTTEAMEKLIERAFEETETHISFAFQGGEPMLAGLDFFRHFVAHEKKIRCPGVQVDYSIQTNGTLISEEWADFFRENHFLVGLSLDGTKDLHDLHRRDAHGNGSYKTVLQALRILQKAQVEVNLLCVVTGPLSRRAQAVYQSLKKLNVGYLQFIPCLDPLDGLKSGFSLQPERYGKFLCTLFDQWYRDWECGSYVSVRLFDDYVHLLAGQPAGACATAGNCGRYLVVEADGSVYPCDFFVLDEYRLGNLMEHSFAKLTQNACSFCEKGRGVPAQCSSCPWISLCSGGCQREWAGTEKNENCAAYRAFFSYAMPRLQQIAALERHWSHSGLESCHN